MIHRMLPSLAVYVRPPSHFPLQWGMSGSRTQRPWVKVGYGM